MTFFNSNRQRGFTLLELMLTLSIGGILAIYAQSRFVKDAEETLAEGSALYIAKVASAAQAHALVYFDQYANGLPVPGLATPATPTLPELLAAGRLSSGFPVAANSMPTRQSLNVTVTRTGVCPGATCTLTVLACTTTAVTLGGPNTRFDLASTMTAKQGGGGAQSLVGNGTRLIGPMVNVANPYTPTEGIVCGTSSIDTALYLSFVKRGDTRDPQLAGPLTVAGATTLNGTATVTGATTLNGATTINNNLTVTGAASASSLSLGGCVNINGATGRAGFGCQNGSNIPAGYTGGVRSTDVVANANILASDNPAGFTGANTNYALVTANNGTGVAEVRTSGRAAADRLTPTGSYAPNAVCTAADEGSIARSNTGNGLVVCQASAWRSMATLSAANTNCAPEGATATATDGKMLLCVNGRFRAMDAIIAFGTPGTACSNPGTTAIDTSSNNETLICRANPAGGSARYFRLRDLTTNLIFNSASEVGDGDLLPQPTCTAASGMSVLPLLQLIPKAISTLDGGISLYGVVEGTSWRIHLKDGTGRALLGSPRAISIAQTFCYYI
jgi:prepilin-type N-terminal cleavage/methylation domain-containing protein